MTNEKKVMVLVFPGECPDRSLNRVDRSRSAISVECGIFHRGCFVFEALDQIVRQQVGEWQFQIRSSDALRTDEDSFKEGPIERSSHVVWGAGVGLRTVRSEVELCVEVAFDFIEAQSARVENSLHLPLLVLLLP